MPSSRSPKRSSLWRRRSSCSRFSVRSRVILENPRCTPSRSYRGVSTTLAQKRLLSLRKRQPSSSKRPRRSASSSARGGLQLVLRPTLVDRRLGIERGEVPPDDFLGLVPLYALGPPVPADDVSFRVEQEHRVVADFLDHATVGLVAPGSGGGRV